MAALAGGLLALAVLGCAGQMEKPATAPPAMEMKKEMDHAGHAGHTGHTDHAGHADPAPSVAVAPGQPAGTLKPDALDAPAATSVADAQRSVEIAEEMSSPGSAGSHEGHGGHEGHGAQGGQGGHSGHGSGTYVHVDAGRETAAQESHGHHGHEGHGMAEQGMTEKKEAAEAYVCPMHPEVTSATPDKCPKCGMDLVKRRKE